MMITYPHMGSLSWLLGALFREQGIPFIAPPPCSKQTLELGVRYAPQGACLPMKIVLGSFLEAQKQGADTALFFGGCGPCRFGYFAAMFQEICEEWGIPLRIIALEAPDHDIGELVRRIQEVMGKKALHLPILVAEGSRAAKALDEAEEALGDAKLCLSGQGEKLQLEHWEQDWRRRAEKAASLKELRVLAHEAVTTWKPNKPWPEEMVRIGIVGDIYSTIEPFVNFQLQRKLADMEVFSRRSITISRWLKDAAAKKLSPLPAAWEKEGSPFLNTSIGGFAKETVGYSAYWSSLHWDGIIQVYPLSCMPEIVAQSILPKVSEHYGVPILTLVVDELTGEAGYQTRGGAVVDMVKRKKRRQLAR